MKDRIKKFFKEHEDQIAIAQLVVGVTAGAIGIRLLRQGDNQRVIGVWSKDLAPGGTVVLALKSGKMESFTKPYEQ